MQSGKKTSTLSDFGDAYELESLPLPRPAQGYAVQYLGRDEILDCKRLCFLSIRTPALQGLFPSFAEARHSAEKWLTQQNGEGSTATCPPLAIVPAAFDPDSERHILIYGVLNAELSPEELAPYVKNTEVRAPGPSYGSPPEHQGSIMPRIR